MLSRWVMLATTAMAGAALRNAGAGDADAEPVLIGDFLGGGLDGGVVEVDGDDVCAFLDEAQRDFAADAAAGADDGDDLAREFLFGRHALELGFLKEPVLDVEGLLLRERDVAVDGLGAAHDLDGAAVDSAVTRDSLLSLPQAMRPRPGRG